MSQSSTHLCTWVPSRYRQVWWAAVCSIYGVLSRCQAEGRTAWRLERSSASPGCVSGLCHSPAVEAWGSYLSSSGLFRHVFILSTKDKTFLGNMINSKKPHYWQIPTTWNLRCFCSATFISNVRKVHKCISNQVTGIESNGRTWDLLCLWGGSTVPRILPTLLQVLRNHQAIWQTPGLQDFLYWMITFLKIFHYYFF